MRWSTRRRRQCCVWFDAWLQAKDQGDNGDGYLRRITEGCLLKEGIVVSFIDENQETATDGQVHPS